MWCKVGVQQSSFFFKQMLPVGAAFVENRFFSLNCLDIVVIGHQLLVYVWVFFWILFCLTDLSFYQDLSILNTVALQELRYYISLPILYLFFKSTLTILGHLLFHINFGISLPVSGFKKSWWNFDWNCIESMDRFRKNSHNLPIHECDISLHFIKRLL